MKAVKIFHQNYKLIPIYFDFHGLTDNFLSINYYKSCIKYKKFDAITTIIFNATILICLRIKGL